MSTEPPLKFVAYRKFAPPFVARARPLYTASLPERSATITAFVPAAWFHAEIVPSSPAKMNNALLPPLIRKSVVELNTCPVGFPPGDPPALGIPTTSESLPPVPLYSVESEVPLSLTHNVPPELNAIPHGLTRFASTVVAPRDASSAASLVSSYDEQRTGVVGELLSEHATTAMTSPAAMAERFTINVEHCIGASR